VTVIGETEALGESKLTLAEKAEILVEALPYIRRFAGSTIVVKYGGNAIAQGDGGSQDRTLQSFAQDIVLLQSVGLRPIVVHGGGPQIDTLIGQMGLSSEFVDGLRVTDSQTLEIVKMVLLGQVNPGIVSQINRLGARGIGINGADAQLLRCTPFSERHGFVGTVREVNSEALRRLVDEGFIPVVASIATDENGQMFNVNADHVASALAASLRAEKLVYLTDIEGLRLDVGDPTSLVRSVKVDELRGLLASGAIAGGMIPKIRSALEAVESGVGAIHLLDGRAAHALLLEIFTDVGIGTMIYADT
jgi:acetylglutamate kinase